MRKRKKGRKFHRPANQRKALLRELASQLFLGEKIKTTQAKAKELRRIVEKFVTRAKRGGKEERRYLLRFFSKNIVKKLIDEIGPRYKGRKGGYTRVIKLGPRKSDGAKMAQIELIK